MWCSSTVLYPTWPVFSPTPGLEEGSFWSSRYWKLGVEYAYRPASFARGPSRRSAATRRFLIVCPNAGWDTMYPVRTRPTTTKTSDLRSGSGVDGLDAG